MPTIQEILKAYEELCIWPDTDDVDSAAWGTSTAEWYCTVLPRIHEFVPTGTILEIGPGNGRWTHFLRALCKRLIVVDLSRKCIEACKKRFCSDTHIIYHTNDGTSLNMIPDRSVDFVFSFDSIVCAEADVIERYLVGISRKLTEKGSGFIHHSNVGDLPLLLWLLRLSERLHLRRLNLVERQDQWRAHSMTAGSFRAFCARTGLACVRQELIPWAGSRFCIDCFSTFTAGNPASARECLTVRNPKLRLEAKRALWLSKVYTSGCRKEPIPR
jgi:SAM-dependent methyltransferase